MYTQEIRMRESDSGDLGDEMQSDELAHAMMQMQNSGGVLDYLYI